MKNVSSRGSNQTWLSESAWLLGSLLARNAAVLLIIVALARFSNQDVVGQYALALAITGPIFVFAQMGLRNVYLSIQLELHWHAYQLLQLAGIIFASALSIAISAVFSPDIMAITALTALLKSVDAFVDLASGPLQRAQKTQQIFWATLTASVISVASAMFSLAAGWGLPLTLGLVSLTSGLISLGLIVFPAQRATRNIKTSVNAQSVPQQIKSLLLAGLPNGFALAVLSFLAYLPQYFVSAIWGSAELARFVAIMYVIVFADLFMSAVAQGWLPGARTRWIETTGADRFFARDTQKTALTWSIVAAPASAVGLGLFWFVLPIVFGADYTFTLGEAIPILVSVMTMPWIYFCTGALLIFNRYRVILFSSMLALALSAAASALFVSTLGIFGALSAVAIGFITRAMTTLFAMHRSAKNAANHSRRASSSGF